MTGPCRRKLRFARNRLAGWAEAARAWLGLPPMWWLGTPYRVTIAPCGQAGYVLKIGHRHGVEWVHLPARAEPPTRPDEREFTAASAALRDRGLAWVLPWELDEHGNLTAPVTTDQHPTARSSP
jgi:hypothetical protein